MLTSEALSRARISLSDVSNDNNASGQVSRVKTEPTEAVGEVFNQIEQTVEKTFEENSKSFQYRNEEKQLPGGTLFPYNSQEHIDTLASGNTNSITPSNTQFDSSGTFIKANSMVSSNRNSASTATTTDYLNQRARPSSSDQRATKELYQTLNSIIADQIGMTYSNHTSADTNEYDHQSDKVSLNTKPQLTVTDHDAKIHHQFGSKISPESVTVNSSNAVTNSCAGSSTEILSAGSAGLAGFYSYDSIFDCNSEYYKKQYHKSKKSNNFAETLSNPSSKQHGHSTGDEHDILGNLIRETPQSLSAATIAETVSRKSRKQLKHRGSCTNDKYDTTKLMVETPQYSSATSAKSGRRKYKRLQKGSHYSSSEEHDVRRDSNSEAHAFSATSESVNYLIPIKQREHSTSDEFDKNGELITETSQTLSATTAASGSRRSVELDKGHLTSDESHKETAEISRSPDVATESQSYQSRYLHRVSTTDELIKRRFVASTLSDEERQDETMNSPRDTNGYSAESSMYLSTLPHISYSTSNEFENQEKSSDSLDCQSSKRPANKSSLQETASSTLLKEKFSVERLRQITSKSTADTTSICNLSSDERLSARSIPTNESDFTFQKSVRLQKLTRSRHQYTDENLSRHDVSSESLSERTGHFDNIDYTYQQSEDLSERSYLSKKSGNFFQQCAMLKMGTTPVRNLSSPDSLSDRSLESNGSDYTVQNSAKLGGKSIRSREASSTESLSSHTGKLRMRLTPIRDISSADSLSERSVETDNSDYTVQNSAKLGGQSSRSREASSTESLSSHTGKLRMRLTPIRDISSADSLSERSVETDNSDYTVQNSAKLGGQSSRSREASSTESLSSHTGKLRMRLTPIRDISSADSLSERSVETDNSDYTVQNSAKLGGQSIRSREASSTESLSSHTGKLRMRLTPIRDISSADSLSERSVETDNSDYTVQKSAKLGGQSSRSREASSTESLSSHTGKLRMRLTPIRDISSADSLSERSVETDNSDYTVQNSAKLGGQSSRSREASSTESLSSHTGKLRMRLTPIRDISSADSLSERSVETDNSDYTVQKSERLERKSAKSRKTSSAESLSQHSRKQKGDITPIQSLSSAESLSRQSRRLRRPPIPIQNQSSSESLSGRSAKTDGSDYTIQKSVRLARQSSGSQYTSSAKSFSQRSGKLKVRSTPIRNLSSAESLSEHSIESYRSDNTSLQSLVFQ